MGHDIPNLIGVDQEAVAGKMRKFVSGYMPMGSNGMGEMGEMQMQLPRNTLPMMTGDGQFGPIGMGGMFTILKVRDGITNYDDPGWYKIPPGTQAGLASADDLRRYGIPAPGQAAATQATAPAALYTCPMHSAVIARQPGRCPECGMKLVPK
jgi:hypothetical protein